MNIRDEQIKTPVFQFIQGFLTIFGQGHLETLTGKGIEEELSDSSLIICKQYLFCSVNVAVLLDIFFLGLQPPFQVPSFGSL